MEANQPFIVPSHGLPTTYQYNSLNEPVQQSSPDAGTSTFIYDRLGRLAVSQNALQAQPPTYPGGIYTAVNSGNWSGGGIWDANGQPPLTCNACEIIINSGLTVTLNVSQVLQGGSLLQIGAMPGGGSTRLVIQTSGGAFFNSSYSVLLRNESSYPWNSISFIDNNSTLDASGTSPANTYDGVWSFIPGAGAIYIRLIGKGIPVYVAGTFEGSSDFSNPSMSGPANINMEGIVSSTPRNQYGLFNYTLYDPLGRITEVGQK